MSSTAARLISADGFAPPAGSRATDGRSRSEEAARRRAAAAAAAAARPPFHKQGAPGLYMYSCTPRGGSRIVPVQPLAGRTVVKLAATEDKVYVLDTDGKLHCITDAMRPVPTLPFRAKVLDVAAGPDHLIVLTQSANSSRRVVYGLGNNRSGQLGLSDTRRAKTPRVVPGIGANPTAVFAGACHTAVLLARGDALRFGGKPVPQEQTSPEVLHVADGINICQVGLGVEHCVVLTGAGGVWFLGRHTRIEKEVMCFTHMFDALWDSACVQILATDAASYAVSSTGAVFGWGMLPRALLEGRATVVSALHGGAEGGPQRRKIPKGLVHVEHPKRLATFDDWACIATAWGLPGKERKRGAELEVQPVMGDLLGVSRKLKLAGLCVIPGAVDAARAMPLHKAVRRYWVTAVAQTATRRIVFTAVPDPSAGPDTDVRPGTLAAVVGKDEDGGGAPNGPVAGAGAGAGAGAAARGGAILAPRVSSENLARVSGLVMAKRMKERHGESLEAVWHTLSTTSLPGVTGCDLDVVCSDGAVFKVHSAFVCARSRWFLSQVVAANEAAAADDDDGSGRPWHGPRAAVVRLALGGGAPGTDGAEEKGQEGGDGEGSAAGSPEAEDAPLPATGGLMAGSVLAFLYTGQVGNDVSNNKHHLRSLLAAATVWQVPSLAARCQTLQLADTAGAAGGAGGGAGVGAGAGAGAGDGGRSGDRAITNGDAEAVRRVLAGEMDLGASHGMRTLLAVCRLRSEADEITAEHNSLAATQSAAELTVHETLHQLSDELLQVAAVTPGLVSELATAELHSRGVAVNAAANAVADAGDGTGDAGADDNGAEGGSEVVNGGGAPINGGDDEQAGGSDADEAKRDSEQGNQDGAAHGGPPVLRGRRLTLAQWQVVREVNADAPELAVAITMVMQMEAARREVAAAGGVASQMRLMRKWEEEPHHAPLRRQAFGSAKPFGSVTFATLEAAKEATGERRRGKGNRRRTTRLRKRAEAMEVLKKKEAGQLAERRAHMLACLLPMRCDVMVRASSEPGAPLPPHVWAHAAILRARIPSLRPALEHNPAEVIVSSALQDPRALASFMQYVYCAEPQLSTDVAVPLFVAAAEHGLTDLREAAADFIMSRCVETSNADDVHRLATELKEPRLQTFAAAVRHRGVIEDLFAVHVTAGVGSGGGDGAVLAPHGEEELAAMRGAQWARNRRFDRVDRHRQLRAKADGFLMKHRDPFTGRQRTPSMDAAMGPEELPPEKPEVIRARARAAAAASLAEVTRNAVHAIEATVVRQARANSESHGDGDGDGDGDGAGGGACDVTGAAAAALNDTAARYPLEAEQGESLLVRQVKWFLANRGRGGTDTGPVAEAGAGNSAGAGAGAAGAGARRIVATAAPSAVADNPWARRAMARDQDAGGDGAGAGAPGNNQEEDEAMHMAGTLLPHHATDGAGEHSSNQEPEDGAPAAAA